MIARLISTALGLFLVASPAIWPCTSSQLLSARICGMVLALVALVLPAGPWHRAISFSIGLWLLLSGLFVSSWLEPGIRFHAVMGLLLLVLTAVPASGNPRPQDARFS